MLKAEILPMKMTLNGYISELKAKEDYGYSS